MIFPLEIARQKILLQFYKLLLIAVINWKIVKNQQNGANREHLEKQTWEKGKKADRNLGRRIKSDYGSYNSPNRM